MTNQIGIRNSNIIVPYTAATKRTKQVDLTISVTNFVNTRSVGVAYADSNGVWRLSFNASLKGNGSVGSVTVVTFTVTGVVFKSGTDVFQPLSVFQSNSLAGQAITTPGASTFKYNNPGSIDLSSRAVDVSGDVELNAEPSWAAANMEGVLPVDVYIPPVSSGVAGIFPALNTELDNVTATRLGLKQYLHGTTYNGGNAPTVTYTSGGGTLSAVNRAVFIPYQSQDGTWRLKLNGNITLSSASRTEVQFTINGVTSIALYQAIPGSAGDGTNPYLIIAAVKPSSGVVDIACASATTTIYYFAGDIELASKPTWAY